MECRVLLPTVNVTRTPWETDAATTSEKKGFEVELFGNTFFTHIPWTRQPSGFETDSIAGKKLRGVLHSQFDQPLLTIRHRTFKKSYFLVISSTNLQYLGGFGGACTSTGLATTRNTSNDTLKPSRMDLKNGAEFEFF